MDYLGILICAVLSMVLGFLWYGPIFGKKWMWVIGASAEDESNMKGMGKLYALAFALSVLQAYVLSLFVSGIGVGVAVRAVVMIWLGIIVPVVAGGSMWNHDKARVAWSRFLIQAFYYLVLMVVFAFVLAR